MIAFDAIEPHCITFDLNKRTVLHICVDGKMSIYGVECGYIDPKLVRAIQVKLMMDANEVHVPGFDMVPLKPEDYRGR